MRGNSARFRVHLGKYFKAAFTNRWNLLLFCGGLGAALVSGSFDVLAPLVLAAEVGYVALLGTRPKFQKYVDAMRHQGERASRTESNERVLNHILSNLSEPARQRYQELRARCLELRQIAADLKQPSALDAAVPLDSYQSAGLDRLLWVYLRLLFTQHALGRFLQQTRPERIRAETQRTEARLKQVDAQDTSPHAQKIRRTLEDNLQTSQARLANYEKAQANHQFVELEIDRLENKIKSLAEMAVNRQEPEFISSQVDQVATSMVETEKTMNELDFATGIGPLDEEVPELLQRTPQIIEQN